ncbi:IclR family transcriptional regulator [Nocardiopsis oceani]
MAEDSPTKKDKAGPTYPISSVDNALRLLLMFRDQERLRLSDVATALDVAHSTAHRLLAMLMHHGFVRQEGDLRTYVLGPAMLDVGFAAIQKMDIRTYARPVLEDLAQKVEETVHLARLEGNTVRYLISAESRHPLRVADRTGQVLAAHLTATGKAMLADLGTDQLNELYPKDGEVKDGIALSPESREELDKELALVRERGYASNHREDEDIFSLATTVRSTDGRTVGAINASAPSRRMGPQRQFVVVRQLHAAAARLEELLGDQVRR